MNLKNTIENIQNDIKSAQKRGGFNHPVQFIAVTKTHPFSLIKKCHNAGIEAIGENRIQEAIQKFESFDFMPGLTKRFIGHLQSNKVNKCLDMFDTIDSVDSLKLAKKISFRAKTLKRNVSVLLEINTSGEPQKQGFKHNQKSEMLLCLREPNIQVTGLMTIGPNTTNKDQIRKAFVALRNTRDALNQALGEAKLTDLSMGMSGDYEIAAEEGSTMVRIGTALFGKRGNT
ncbi:MAG: YggS family pyridoxal phosphate-dependent enzyme [Candidatus Marinimicrobia bacterium]|nr:YggS family pyridoxal phosphate-dependent enzyme [Candidatus Neomarinimicrobiota bacterium]